MLNEWIPSASGTSYSIRLRTVCQQGFARARVMSTMRSAATTMANIGRPEKRLPDPGLERRPTQPKFLRASNCLVTSAASRPECPKWTSFLPTLSHKRACILITCSRAGQVDLVGHAVCRTASRDVARPGQPIELAHSGVAGQLQECVQSDTGSGRPARNVGDERWQCDVHILNHIAEPMLRVMRSAKDAKDAQDGVRVGCALRAVLDGAHRSVIPHSRCPRRVAASRPGTRGVPTGPSGFCLIAIAEFPPSGFPP